VMLRGGDQQFENECRRIVEAGKPGGGFVFSTGGELSPGTDPQRVRAMARAASQFGTYAT
jgi:uroporphyrinogen-III decarboxylase